MDKDVNGKAALQGQQRVGDVITKKMYYKSDYFPKESLTEKMATRPEFVSTFMVLLKLYFGHDL